MLAPLAPQLVERPRRGRQAHARIAVALPGSAVIVKRLSLPAMSPQELADAITWEAEQYIPFDLADVQLDYEVQPSQAGATETDLLLVAAKKVKIAERVDAVLAAVSEPAPPGTPDQAVSQVVRNMNRA